MKLPMNVWRASTRRRRTWQAWQQTYPRHSATYTGQQMGAASVIPGFRTEIMGHRCHEAEAGKRERNQFRNGKGG